MIFVNEHQKKLKNSVETAVSRLNKAKQERHTLLAQMVYLGSIGAIFVVPIILGAYLGVWLDNKLSGFSFSWTISLIFLGIVVGVINVYLFFKD